ncbi:DUF4251 domain-containing protein [Winogradskyella echinorum]|uniref:DUF4251 domain-containing protein n=1 Tax=Winogradskyella echinorum TaxID=538189 RepID=A0ABR6Y0L8_9FLAO|nr:DUF4251 domain-containing protein [Winogradskyella echinorum]MBC3846281.1 DUF4251 domain-containing protein [Winogradskyella echinorum]MBC5750629.1 DUF4251 domain-containing protein [Winogradskyella echinorum]
MIKAHIYQRIKLLILLGVFCLLFNCKSKANLNDSAYVADISQLEALMENDAYHIDIEVAYPFTTAATTQVVNALLLQNTGNSANRIDVRGDGNSVIIQNDSVIGDLSFFGERRLSAGRYGSSDGGIHFEGIPKNFEKTINKEKRKLEINFKTNEKQQSSETYDVNIVIFPSKRVEVKVTSTFRTFMRYSGRLLPVKPQLE